jgi:hypothetical protein
MHRPPQFQGSARCSPASCALVAVARLGDSSSVGISMTPSSDAGCECHTRWHQDRFRESNQVILRAYPGGPNPCGQRIASLLCNLELYGALGLLLHHYRACSPTRSHDLSLLSMARLKSASSRVRWPICNRTRIAQMSFSLRGAFCPTSFPLFHGVFPVAT